MASTLASKSAFLLSVIALLNLTHGYHPSLAGTPPTNHIIRFSNFLHEYASEPLATQALEANLEMITGHNITVDELDSTSASWHSEDLSLVSGCPEEMVKNLHSSLYGLNGDFSRKFKMFMTEYFSRPGQVYIEWLGPCANLGRKRSEVPLDKSSTSMPSNPTTTEATAPPTTEATTATTTVATTEATTDATTVSETSVSTGASLFGDFNATEWGYIENTTPNATEAPTSEAASTEASSSEISLKTLADEAPFKTLDSDNFFSNEKQTSEVPTTETPTSETPTSEAPPTEAQTSSEGPTTGTPLLRAETPEPPHYAKYIGFAAAFLAAVAYLACRQARGRQGVYELHSE